VSVAVSVAVSCRSTETLPLGAASSSVSTAVSVAVRSAVSRSAHDCAMIRFRSTHNDRPTSVPPRTPRHPATIEAARARHSLDDLARPPSHGQLDRSPSLQVHLDDGICHCFGRGQAGGVVEWVCQSEGVGWRQAIRILDLTAGCVLGRAWAVHESSPSRRDSSSSRLPAGRYFATHAAVVEMTPDQALLVTADGPAL
jgi:hypothetical protein